MPDDNGNLLLPPQVPTVDEKKPVVLYDHMGKPLGRVTGFTRTK